jgi:iron complex transport system substrate-binding protein
LRALLLAAALVLGSAPAFGQGAEAAARVAVIDDAGEAIRLTGPARRIVSLNPTTTEILFAIGAGRWLVGRTSACDYPDAVASVPSIGGGFPPNVEAVAGLRPDLVVLYHGSGNAAAARRIRQLGIPLVELRTDHLADVPRAARMLGTLTGTKPAADSLATGFIAALEQERARVERPGPRIPVVLLAWDQPIIVLGSGSFISELIELAGGRNVFADVAASSAPVTLEAIVARAPEIVVSLGASPGFADRPEWQALPAVRNQRLLRFTESVFNRPSPRAPEAIGVLRARLGITQ